MTNTDDVRRAHNLLDSLFDNSELSHAQIDLIRGLMPELPAQKTLEEITAHVYDAWLASSDREFNGNEYDPDIAIEDWLLELHKHLKELTSSEPAHPEFLETEADYENAPEGTIVACEDSPPWHKFDSEWLSTITHGRNNDKSMVGVIRRVLRWGDGE